MKFEIAFSIVVILSALSLEAKPKFSPSESLWYAQPAVVTDMPVPWAKGKTPCQNYGGGGVDDLESRSNQYCAPNAAAQKSRDPWESQSLPIGNGRVGGTCFGGDHRDRINLNEISLWTGGPNLPNNGAGYAYGPKAGKDQFGCYQPFGNLVIDYALEGKTESYARSLSLRRAVALTEFTNNGVKHVRRAFVSHPDDALVYLASVDKPGQLTAKIGLTPCHDVDFSIDQDVLVMRGTLANGEQFEGRMFVRATGAKAKVAFVNRTKHVTVNYEGKGDGLRPVFDGEGIPYLSVENADSFEVIVSLATDYKEDYQANWKGEDPSIKNRKVIATARAKSVEKLFRDHLDDYRSYYSRLKIDLGTSDEAVRELPTDRRILKYRETLTDPELEALVYQYGRYMLISGSRPGNLPLTLQGIWNDKVHAAWGSDYHNNINLQMCYWGAEVANLSECHTPFIDFIRVMEDPLHEMTKKQFGAGKKGWTTRISQNPWGGGGWVKWNPPVNAWYALHLWDHYQYTQSKSYLRKVGYPALKQICEFWETMLKEVGEEGKGLKTNNGRTALTAADHPELKEIKKGSLVSPDGWSHEQGPVEDACMHDQQLIWELFDNTAKAARILKVDEAWAKNLIAKRDRLVPNRVAKGGYLQEWVVDRPNMVTGHRHTSHLIGIFPGSMLWVQPNADDLVEAAEKSLDLRGMSGDNRRSWTWPWRTALWARFKKPNRAYEMVQSYIRWNCLDNLFGNHPPMQMDGTYGMTGGMSEILLQSHTDRLELLPALPKAWKTGSISGIRARGNLTVNMTWVDGKVTKYDILTTTPNPAEVKVVVNGETKTVLPKVISKKTK